MKRIPIILGNALIVLATLAFVVIYANNQQRQIQETQTEAWPTAPGPYNQPCRAWISGRAGYPSAKGWLAGEQRYDDR